MMNNRLFILTLSTILLAGCSQVDINQCSNSCTNGTVENKEQVECIKMCLDYKNKKNVTSSIKMKAYEHTALLWSKR